MVSECKIRQLQTENEALRIHLKLALDSLRNPIPAIPLQKRLSSLGSLRGEEEDAATAEREDQTPEPEGETSAIWEDDPADQPDPNELEAHEMQADMEHLLHELGLFKRKMAADHERFGINKISDARKQRRAFGRVLVNNS
jgi:hypothetical protein